MPASIECCRTTSFLLLLRLKLDNHQHKVIVWTILIELSLSHTHTLLLLVMGVNPADEQLGRKSRAYCETAGASESSLRKASLRGRKTTTSARLLMTQQDLDRTHHTDQLSILSAEAVRCLIARLCWFFKRMRSLRQEEACSPLQCVY